MNAPNDFTTQPLAGQTALVTGATRGIGRCVALSLASAGASVAIHGRSVASAQEVAGVLAGQGKHAGTFLADLSESLGVEKLLAAGFSYQWLWSLRGDPLCKLKSTTK